MTRMGPHMAGKAQQTDKRKVVMRTIGLAANGDTLTYEATDYVPESILEVYLADARTRWQAVIVEEGYDAGPGGVDGETASLPHLDGRTPAEFSRYGDASDPNHNALDEHLAAQGIKSTAVDGE